MNRSKSMYRGGLKSPKGLALAVMIGLVLQACGSTGEGGATTDVGGESTATTVADGTRLVCSEQSLSVAQVVPTFNNLPFYVADSAGYFDGLNLEITELQAGSEVASAMVSGSVELALGPLSTLYAGRQEGAPVVAIATISDYFPAVIAVDRAILEEREIALDAPVDERAQALVDINIGITTPGGGTDQTIRTIMTHAGLDPDTDTRIVPVGSMPGMVSAWESGELQAISSTHPDADRAVARVDAEWLFPIGSHPALQDLTAITVYTVDDLVEPKRDALTCFVAGIERALQTINGDPEAAIEFAWPAFEEGFEGADKSLFDQAFENGRAQYAEHVDLIESQAAKAREFANTYAERPLEVDPSEVITNELAERAREYVDAAADNS